MNYLLIPPPSLGDGNYLAAVWHIITSLDDNPHFPTPWAAQVPPLTELKSGYQTLNDAYHAALSRDTVKIELRKAARARLHDMIKKVARYIEMVADGDMVKLKTTGFELHAEVGRPSGPLPAPSDFRVKHGALSGTLDIHIAKLSGAGCYEVQITFANDPSDESTWRHVTMSISSQHIALNGLTPGQAIWVRVRAMSAGNVYGAFTAPVRIIVV